MVDFRARIFPYTFFVLFFVGFIWFLRMPSCKTYDCITIPDKNLTLVDEYEDTNTSWRGLMRSDDREIRLKIFHNIPRIHSEEITNIHIATLLGLYDVSLSPYPGAISQTIRCDEAFKPVPQKIISSTGQHIMYFAGLLNARMQYGSCIENQIAYRSYVGFFYCEKQEKWAQIELIVPKDSTVSDSLGKLIIQSISCKK